VLGTKHYLVNMPDPLLKQTLCVIPDTNVRPTTWEEVAKKKVNIINRQHSVVASKDMQTLRLLENIVKHFREWNCFIV
jgi:hypothetical protein